MPNHVLPSQVITRLNEIRAQAGLAPVVLDTEMSDAALLHAEYLAVHSDHNEKHGLTGHDEDPALPEYTEKGAQAGQRSLISYRPPLDAVDNLMSTFYHRIPLLRPSLDRVGLGYAGTSDAVNTVVHVTSDALTSRIPLSGSIRGYPVAYPVKGQREVPLAFARERPNPVPGGQKNAGFPITLDFGPIMVRHVTARLLDAAGADVAVFLSTPEQPALTTSLQDGVVCMIPQQTLQPDTTYRVQITAQASGKRQAWNWEFTTMTPLRVDAASPADVAREVGRLVWLTGNVRHTGRASNTGTRWVALDDSADIVVWIDDSVWPALSAAGVQDVEDLWRQRIEALGTLTCAGDDVQLTVASSWALRVANANPLSTQPQADSPSL